MIRALAPTTLLPFPLGLLLAASCPGQAGPKPATQQPAAAQSAPGLAAAEPLAEFVNGKLSYRISLPKSWRRLTPDEALKLRPQLPPDLQDLPIPGHFYRLGAVDRWLREGFDGHCLSVTETEGEPQMDDSTLQRVRTHNAKASNETLRLEIEELGFAEFGAPAHPMVRAVVALRDREGKLLARRLDCLVPTGGEALQFSFRAPPSDFEAAAARFDHWLQGLRCAKPAEGPEELSDMLQTALFVGGLVGILLVLLYKGRKA